MTFGLVVFLHNCQTIQCNRIQFEALIHTKSTNRPLSEQWRVRFGSNDVFDFAAVAATHFDFGLIFQNQKVFSIDVRTNFLDALDIDNG